MNMKHLMKFHKTLSASCQRPGCMASIQGNLEDWTQEGLDEYFSGSCPYVFNSEKTEMTEKESIQHLINRAESEINAWKKVINYWKKS